MESKAYTYLAEKTMHLLNSISETKGFYCPNLPGGVFTSSVAEIKFCKRRDKNIPPILSVTPDAVGFFGSDTWLELVDDVRQELVFEPIAETNVSFALACRKGELEKFKDEQIFKSGISIATSYPRQAVATLMNRGIKINSLLGLGGSVEGALEDFSGLDAIFEMVDTGNSIRDNDLDVVLGNLGRLVLGKSWRKER